MKRFRIPDCGPRRWRTVAIAIQAGLLVATAAALGIAVGGCGKTDAAKQDRKAQAVVVTLVKPTLRSVERSVSTVGTVFGREEVTVSAKVSGRIEATVVDVGDAVAPGGLLAQIEQTDYRLTRDQKQLAIRELLAKQGLKEPPSADFDPATLAAVRRAKLQAQNAQSRYDRGRQLREQTPPLISEQDFADLKTAAEVAASGYDVELMTTKSLLVEVSAKQVDLAIAEQRLADTRVLAPRPADLTDAAAASPTAARPATRGSQFQTSRFHVASRLVSAGEYVREGTPLFRLVDDEVVKVRCAVPQRYLDQVQVGQKTSVRVDTYDRQFAGQVARINPQIDPVNRMFQVEIEVANESRLLRSGAFARASILVRTDADVVFVPQESLAYAFGKYKLFTVEGGKAVEHIVTTGVGIGRDVEVAGFDGGQPVVATGKDKIADKMAVQVKSAGAGGAASGPASRPAKER